MILTKRELTARGLMRDVPAQSIKRTRLLTPKSAYVKYDEDGEVSMTADVVEDDPREPIITSTGLLNAAGEELLKVMMPVKVKMGFDTKSGKIQDTVIFRIPEPDLNVSDVGLGKGYIDVAEFEAEEREETAAEKAELDKMEAAFLQAEADGKAVRLSEVIRQITEQGITILDDLGDPDGPI